MSTVQAFSVCLHITDHSLILLQGKSQTDYIGTTEDPAF